MALGENVNIDHCVVKENPYLSKALAYFSKSLFAMSDIWVTTFERIPLKE